MSNSIAAYAQSVVIMIIAHYLHLKQRSTRNEMHSLNVQFGSLSPRSLLNNYYLKHMLQHKFRTINRQYADLMAESLDYGVMSGRIVSIIFLVFVITISYCTYLLFLTQMTPIFVFIYWVVYSAHIGLLSATIQRCSHLARSNHKMASQVIAYFNQATRAKLLFHHRDMLKVRSNSKLKTQLIRKMHFSDKHNSTKSQFFNFRF